MAPDNRTVLLDLAKAIEFRPSPGRIVGQRPVEGLFPREAVLGSGLDTADLKRWAPALVNIQRAGADEQSAEAVANAGLSNLLFGRLERALELLEWAVAIEPSDVLLNDLAAVYLARADIEHRAMDLVNALDASRQAFDLQPDRPEPAFNFALALTRLHLRRSASKAWQHFLELEPRGPWAEEAREHLLQLSDESYSQQWQEIRRRLLGRSDLSDDFIRRAVAEFPYKVRTTCETEILKAWAEAVLDSDRASEDFWFSRASALASALARYRGEHLLLVEIDGIRTAKSQDSKSKLVHRAKVLQSFLDAVSRYEKHDFESASKGLDSSIRPLKELESPFAWVAELYLAVCRHYADLPGTSANLEGLLNRVPEEYPTIRGRVLWMLGTVAGGQRRFEEAAGYYRDAIPLIDAGAGPARAAILQLLLAEVFDLRGEVARGWKHRVVGLQQLASRGDARRRYNVVIEAAQALARHERDELALVFLDEALAGIEDYGVATAGAEIHLEKARIRNRLGQGDLARQELASAADFISRLEETGIKERLQASADMTDGLALVKLQPELAVERLQGAYAIHAESGYRFDELIYFSGLAQAQRLSGDLDGARQTLGSAVDSFDQTRLDAEEINTRVDSFQHAHDVFDQLIELSLASNDPEKKEAFFWAERSRAQTILDLWASRLPDEFGSAVTAREASDRLRPGTVLLQYATIGERVICWAIDRGEIQFRQLEITTSGLTGKTAAFVRAMESGASEDVLRARGRDLHRDLISPLALDLNKVTRLVVVPDGPASQIPFSALVDPESERYLVEQASISFAPSATLFLLAEAKRSKFRSRLSVLAVGNPDLADGPYGYLSDLPFARKEAQAIASHLPGSLLQAGGEATRTRVEESLPAFSAFHFSGHGIASEEGWGASALVLSPSDERDDGLLRVKDLLEQPLHELQLATLSACETLDGYRGGREGNIGLAWAFFSSGVPSVTGTLWRVEDRVSSELMQSFYRELSTSETPSEALQSATLSLLSRAQMSPALWAAFTVIGV